VDVTDLVLEVSRVTRGEIVLSDEQCKELMDRVQTLSDKEFWWAISRLIHGYSIGSEMESRMLRAVTSTTLSRIRKIDDSLNHEARLKFNQECVEFDQSH
jgi:Arc/MetJ family transcription regulator